MNETSASTQPASVGDAVVARQLQHVGAAYLFILVVFFVYAWRVAAATKRLSDRVDELERGRPR